MITIKPEPSYSLGFSVEGHAGYAPTGMDIVCASISTAAYLTAYGTRSHLLNNYDGYMKVQYEDTETNQQLVNAFLHTARELESQYPYHVKVE